MKAFESSGQRHLCRCRAEPHVVPLVRISWIRLSTDVFCIGSNYVWTWETNRVIREIVTSTGGRMLAERLLELGETAVDHIVQ